MLPAESRRIAAPCNKGGVMKQRCPETEWSFWEWLTGGGKEGGTGVGG